MDQQALVNEARTLLDYVRRGHTSLAESEMVLDNSLFTDPERYAAETEALFRNHALCIGPSCLLREPGDYFTFSDTGIPLVVVRGTDGVVRGFLNMCSHRNAPVAVGQGKAKGNVFSCPYHGWTYTLDGRLRAIAYQKEGFPACTDKEKLGLRPVQVAERNGMIFVMPNPERSFDVEEVEAGIGADMLSFGLQDHYLYDTARMVVRQNFKSLLEGYHDFYHFQALHPNTIAAMSYSNVGNYRQFGRGHCLSAPTLQIRELEKIPEQQWRPREFMSFVYYCFPATVFFVVADHFQVWRVYPVDSQTTVVYQSMYLPQLPQTPEEQQARREYFSLINKVVIEEDYWLGEMIQKGFDSGIRRQFILGRNEIGVQNMHRQIADLMGGGGTRRRLAIV